MNVLLAIALTVLCTDAHDIELDRAAFYRDSAVTKAKALHATDQSNTQQYDQRYYVFERQRRCSEIMADEKVEVLESFTIANHGVPYQILRVRRVTPVSPGIYNESGEPFNEGYVLAASFAPHHIKTPLEIEVEKWEEMTAASHKAVQDARDKYYGGKGKAPPVF
jgi:hypothetical protein